jgi:MoxR-like ATPase
MPDFVFSGNGPMGSVGHGEAPRSGASLATARDRIDDPVAYSAPAPLINAVNVAITLGMPLLLTGEPGMGKTQLAYRLAAELGVYQDSKPDSDGRWSRPIRFNTKSSSIATDLFYTYDNIAHFSEAQIAALIIKGAPGANQAAPPLDALKFIRFRALGEAILCSRDRGVDKDWNWLEPCPDAERIVASAGRRRVVLIDEIDKAQRDFPNDLLDQIEQMSFEIAPRPDLPPIEANADRLPIVVITSNSERQLPEAFLRRCIYHHIAWPEGKDAKGKDLAQEWLREIVVGRLSAMAPAAGAGFNDLMSYFFGLRSQPSIEKPASTSEFLDWLRVLQDRKFDFNRSAKEQNDKVHECLGVIDKTRADSKLLRSLIGSPTPPKR